MQDTGASLVAGALIMYLQRWLKRFDWYARFIKAFPTADKTMHRLIAGSASIIAALGIHYTLAGDVTSGWVFHVTIPSLAALQHSAWDFTQVFVSQQLAYDMTRKPVAMPHDPSADQQLAGGGSVVQEVPTVVVPVKQQQSGGGV